MYDTAYLKKEELKTFRSRNEHATAMQKKSSAGKATYNKTSFEALEPEMPDSQPAEEKQQVFIKYSPSGTSAHYTFPKPAQHKFLPGMPVIQAKLSIGTGKDAIVLSPHSKTIKPFFYDVIVPFLNENNYRSYGILSQLRNFISQYQQDVYFSDKDSFIRSFHDYLKKQERNTRGNNKIPVLRQFSITSMSRPAWPRNIRQLLMKKADRSDTATNIRHVIRNNTLRRVLEILYSKNPGAVIQLAKNLGITASSNANDACIRELYRRLYLNTANLWIGNGLVNQIIGFLSTPLCKYGVEISEGKKIFTWDELYSIITNSTAKLKDISNCKKSIIDELYNIITGYIQAYTGLTPYASPADPIVQSLMTEVGELLVDVGLNLGFDLIDDKSDDIAQRQLQLLRVEARLQRYISTNGESEDLLGIFSEFLNISGNSGSPDLDDGISDDDPSGANTPAVMTADERDYALLNNCLIHALADAAGIHVSVDTVIAIRTSLQTAGIARIGDMLDGNDPLTLVMIMTAIGLDPSESIPKFV